MFLRYTKGERCDYRKCFLSIQGEALFHLATACEISAIVNKTELILSLFLQLVEFFFFVLVSVTFT